MRSLPAGLTVRDFCRGEERPYLPILGIWPLGSPGPDELNPIVQPCKIGWNLRKPGQRKKPRLPIAIPQALSFLNLCHIKVRGREFGGRMMGTRQ
jgi:hypothetical protein